MPWWEQEVDTRQPSFTMYNSNEIMIMIRILKIEKISFSFVLQTTPRIRMV
jgi:hypothetical protein